MRVTRILILAASLTAAGSAAMAWGDMYMGDGTNNPNSTNMMHSVGGPNYCPPGLQPVYTSGEICCGVPNAGPYMDHPVVHKKAKKPRQSHAPRAYAPVGAKGVIYK